VQSAIAAGDIRWHAGPFNVQAEVAEASHLRASLNIARDLDDAFGLPHKTLLSQKDVPGATIGLVDVVADAGVLALHVGVNDFSHTPSVPVSSPQHRERCHPFVWRNNATAADVMAFWCSVRQRAT
jgi:hypothetical protein